MQMYTGTRLTTAIHRRLLSRFFLKGGGTSVHRLLKSVLSLTIEYKMYLNPFAPGDIAFSPPLIFRFSYLIFFFFLGI